MIRATLRRISPRRLLDHRLYRYRRVLFLQAHPYCQVWLAERGVGEGAAIAQRGRLLIEGQLVSAPLSTEIHHGKKRRGFDLLDTRFWLAVSSEAHRRIEENKAWARLSGFLLDF